MTTEIVRKLENLERANILSCGDVFNGTVAGLMDCGTCGQKKVSVLKGKLLNLAIESCITKINLGRPAEIFQVIQTQMGRLREGSDVHRIFTEILAEQPNVKETQQEKPLEEKKEGPTPSKVPPYIPEDEEKRATPVRRKETHDDGTFYQMISQPTGFLLHTLDPQEDLISFLFFKDPSGENCVRIKYNPTDELLSGFWEGSFFLRRDSNEYTAKGTEARLLGNFIQRFDSLTRKQKQTIEKFFEDPKKKESVSEFLKNFQEEQNKHCYQDSHDALGLEFQAIEGKGAPLLSISFNKIRSVINCTIEYEVGSDFFYILRKEGFTLRDNSTIYIAEGDEARIFWRLFKPTETLSRKQQQDIETYCDWTDEPVPREEDFAGAVEMGLINASAKPVKLPCYQPVPMTQGAASGSIKYVSDDKEAPLQSFQLNRTKSGQIVAILKYRPNSSFLNTLRKIAKSPMSETYYFMSSKEFPAFWEALKGTQSLTQYQIFAINHFIDGSNNPIENAWQMANVLSRLQNPSAQVHDWKQLVSRLSPLMGIIPQLVPAINMSLEIDPST